MAPFSFWQEEEEGHDSMMLRHAIRSDSLQPENFHNHESFRGNDNEEEEDEEKETTNEDSKLENLLPTEVETTTNNDDQDPPEGNRNHVVGESETSNMEKEEEEEEYWADYDEFAQQLANLGGKSAVSVPKEPQWATRRLDSFAVSPKPPTNKAKSRFVGTEEEAGDEYDGSNHQFDNDKEELALGWEHHPAGWVYLPSSFTAVPSVIHFVGGGLGFGCFPLQFYQDLLQRVAQATQSVVVVTPIAPLQVWNHHQMARNAVQGLESIWKDILWDEYGPHAMPLPLALQEEATRRDTDASNDTDDKTARPPENDTTTNRSSSSSSAGRKKTNDDKKKNRPVLIGMGHSLGARIVVLANLHRRGGPAATHDAAILLSFNNQGPSIPGVQWMQQQWQRWKEQQPQPPQQRRRRRQTPPTQPSPPPASFSSSSSRRRRPSSRNRAVSQRAQRQEEETPWGSLSFSDREENKRRRRMQVQVPNQAWNLLRHVATPAQQQRQGRRRRPLLQIRPSPRRLWKQLREGYYPVTQSRTLLVQFEQDEGVWDQSLELAQALVQGTQRHVDQASQAPRVPCTQRVQLARLPGTHWTPLSSLVAETTGESFSPWWNPPARRRRRSFPIRNSRPDEPRKQLVDTLSTFIRALVKEDKWEEEENAHATTTSRHHHPNDDDKPRSS